VFVDKDDPTIPTGFIDWQSASVDPAFWFADTTPDFADASDSNAESDPPGPGVTACAQAYGLSTEFYSPAFARARSLDDRLFRPFRYVHRTWNDGAIAFQHDLIVTAKEWKDLRF